MGEIETNLISLILPYCLILSGFAVLNIGRTVYLHERRAYQRKIKAQSESESDSPLPNLVCSKVEMVSANIGGGSGVYYGQDARNKALLLSIINEVPHDRRKISSAFGVCARLSYFEPKHNTPYEIIDRACWLGSHGKEASFGIGSNEHLVILFDSNHSPFALDVAVGYVVKKEIRQCANDVLVLVTSGQPKVYSKRFHVLLDAEGPTKSVICNRGKLCDFCKQFVL